ncbi:PREDICTED: formin-like protein 18 [Condylura cristata]|uniref:formin-like protein 18 n=1 Tax=Condylura cristata TaxID=143302 RepID=UPI000643C1B9|nr:PREDICTED: formin-like protein 18 [Condylura cristata]
MGAGRIRNVLKSRGLSPGDASSGVDKSLKWELVSFPSKGPRRVRGGGGMGRGHQGRSLRPFHVSQHHPFPTPPPPSPNPKQSGRRGAPGAGRAGRLGLCGSVLDGGGETEGAGTRAEDPQPGLDPQVHCPAGAAGPPPPPGAATRPPRAPSQRLPPPAVPTSRSPDQGPDVESSPQAGSGSAVHSAAPAPSSHRLTPPRGRTLRPPPPASGCPCAGLTATRHQPPVAPRRAKPVGDGAGSPGCARPAAARGAPEGGGRRTAAASRRGSMPAQPR